jgi:hypothetical protein
MTVEYITQPLTEGQFRAKVKERRIIVVAAIGLYDLIGLEGIDGMNEWVGENVWTGTPTLSDINYKPVGVDGDFVLVEVNADASEVLEEIGGVLLTDAHREAVQNALGND